MTRARDRQQSWASVEALPPEKQGQPIHAPGTRYDHEPLCEQGGGECPDEVLIAGRKRLQYVTCQDCIEWLRA